MRRLFASELLRAWSRHLLPVLLVGIAVGTSIGMTIAAVHSQKPTAQQLARAQSAYQDSLASCLRGDFFGRNQNLPPQYASLEEYCADVIQPENFTSGNVIRLSALPDLLLGIATVVILLGVILGSTYGGADWGAGTMSTLLTWEPRRARVLLVRAAVVALVVFAVAIVAQLFVSLTYAAATALRGSTVTSNGLWGDAFGQMLRNGVLASCFSLVALGAATLTRSTAAAVGALFGYLVIVEGFLGHLWIDVQPRLLVQAAGVIASLKPLIDPRASATYSSDGTIISVENAKWVLTVGRAWVVVAVWVIGIVAIAIGVFRTRDVN